MGPERDRAEDHLVLDLVARYVVVAHDTDSSSARSRPHSAGGHEQRLLPESPAYGEAEGFGVRAEAATRAAVGRAADSPRGIQRSAAHRDELSRSLDELQTFPTALTGASHQRAHDPEYLVAMPGIDPSRVGRRILPSRGDAREHRLAARGLQGAIRRSGERSRAPLPSDEGHRSRTHECPFAPAPRSPSVERTERDGRSFTGSSHRWRPS